MMKKIVSFLTLFFTSALVFAQQEQGVEMADEMMKSGKIYVVIAVLLAIFIGIALYLVVLDKKISALEKENKN